MNEIYVLLIGFGLLIIGIYRFTRQYLTLKKGDIVFAEVVRCKNKSGSKGKRYCYPYVAVTSNTGTVREFYCYAAKRSGHDYYHAGEELELYRYKSFFGNDGYITKRTASSTLLTIVAGIVGVVLSFVLR